MAVLKRELGWRDMLAIIGMTLVIALLAGLLARGMGLALLALGMDG